MAAKLTARTTSGCHPRCGRWLAAGALATLLRASPAFAQVPASRPLESETQAFRVVFSSSSACSNPNEFVEQLQRRTSHLRPANAVEPALTFIVSLNGTPSGVQGNLRVQNPDGAGSSREIPGLDCHEVLSAMALIGALMVDPFALTAEELPPIPPPVPPRPADSEEPSQPDTEPDRAGWTFGAGHRVNINRGVLPGLGWGESVFVQAAFRVSGAFQPGARLAGHFALATRDSELTPPLGSALFTWAAARVAVCPVVWAPLSSVGVRPCVTADLGRLRARGFNTINAREHSIFWAATGVELEVEGKLVGPLTLGAEAGWAFPLVAPERFRFLPRDSEVHRISSGLSAGLGLGLRFF